MPKYNNQTNFKIATFNCQGLNQENKIDNVFNDFSNYKIDILSLQETHIQETISITNKDLILYNSGEKGDSFLGLGFIVNKNLNCNFMTITNRIIVAKFKQNNKVYHILNCYAHTLIKSEKNPGLRTDFYKTISNYIDKTPSKDCLFITGDFNAKVGTLHKTYPNTVGKHGKGTHNSSGEALVETAQQFNMCITNTLFKHKLAHTTTWTTTNKNKKSWNGEPRKNPIRNQIDFILVKRMYRPIVTNSRSYAGTECNSDHRIVITTLNMKLHLLTKEKQAQKQKYDPTKLNNMENKRKFAEEICTNFADKQTNYHELNTNEKYNTIIQTIKSAAQSTIPKDKNRRGTNDPDIQELSDKQKQTRILIQKEASSEKQDSLRKKRRKLQKEISHKIKQNKEADILSKIEEIENSKDDSTKYFKAIRSLQRKEDQTILIKNEKNETILNPVEQEKHIRNYFQKALNMENPEPAKIITPSIMKTPFTTKEIQANIKYMKKGKSCPSEDIEADLLIASPTCIHESIANIFNEIAETGNLPENLTKANLIPLPKPGKPKGPVANLRPIMLLSTIRKLLAICMLKRIEEKINKYIPPTQAAYRKGRGTSEHTLACKMIAEDAYTSDNYTAYLIMLDMSKAYDTVNRKNLLNLLERLLEPEDYHIISLLINNIQIQVKNKNHIGSSFNTSRGVPQGDSLSPSMFTSYLANALDPNLINNYLDRTYHKNKKDSNEIDMQYADDISWILKKETTVNNTLKDIPIQLQKQDLEINKEKTEKYVLSKTKEEWKQCKVLGSKLGTKEDIANRKRLSLAMMNKHHHIFNNNKVSTNTKIRVFNAYISPVFLYNSELWSSNKSTDSEIDVFQRKLLRRVHKVRWYDKITNEEIYRKSNNMEKWSSTIKHRRLKMVGHILRMDNEIPVKKALRNVALNPNKKKGRNNTWLKTIKEDLKNTTIDIHNPHTWQLANNRLTWRKLARELSLTANGST